MAAKAWTPSALALLFVMDELRDPRIGRCGGLASLISNNTSL